MLNRCVLLLKVTTAFDYTKEAIMKKKKNNHLLLAYLDYHPH